MISEISLVSGAYTALNQYYPCMLPIITISLQISLINSLGCNLTTMRDPFQFTQPTMITWNKIKMFLLKINFNIKGQRYVLFVLIEKKSLN